MVFQTPYMGFCPASVMIAVLSRFPLMVTMSLHMLLIPWHCFYVLQEVRLTEIERDEMNGGAKVRMGE